MLAIAAAGVLFTACKDENDDGNTSKTTYEFSVKAEDNPISAPADGKTYTILVTSTKTAQAGTSAVAYEVVSSPEWAPAELEQTALVITVAKNSSTEAREPGKVVLKQDESDKTLEITINQAGFSNSMDARRDLFDRPLQGARDRTDDHRLRPKPRLQMDGEGP